MSPRRNWDSPPPLPQACVPPPPQPKGGTPTRLRVRGWGSPIFDDWRKSTLPTLRYILKILVSFKDHKLSPCPATVNTPAMSGLATVNRQCISELMFSFM